MKSFRHMDVNSVEDCVRRLSESGERARIIAGGTDLLGVLKDRILFENPDIILNIKTISGLDYIRRESGIIQIGALARLSDIASSPILRKKTKMLADAAFSVATPILRDMGTIGGNLCQDVRCWYYRYPHQMGERISCLRKGGKSCQAVKGDNRYHAIMKGKGCFATCPSDTAVALTALDATVTIAGTKGERTVGVKEFYTPLGNVLDPNEIVTEIQVPIPRETSQQTFLKFRLRDAIDFAIVSVGTLIILEDGICKDARVVLGAVSPTSMRSHGAEAAVIGKAIDKSVAEDAAEKALSEAKPLSKNGYKMKILKTLLIKALLLSN